MNLVKWMRKNNRKLMAIVVVLIMIAFVGGYGLQEALSRWGGGGGGVAAYYLDNKRITRKDINAANVELKLLRSLFGAEMLRYRQTVFQAPDYKARLLGQLLFPDGQSAAATSMEMYQAMAQGQLDVMGSDIDEFFSQARGWSEIFWILLREEARQAGSVVNSSQARQVLGQMIPQLAPGASVARALQHVMTAYHMPEEQVLRLFGDLLGVVAYAEMVTKNEAVTTAELRSMTGRGGERLSAEVVKFSAHDFVADQNEPAEETLAAQFERYKDMLRGQVTDDNPHGFGYKLPDRVQLEYLIVKNEDVRAQIAAPTQAAMEKYYADNISQFQEETRTDPDDPDSPTKRVTKRYAEVAEEIRRILIDERTSRLANVIINDAMDLVETGYAGLEMEKATSADLKSKAADYAAAARRLEEQHKVDVYTGTTGMLSMSDLSDDRNLGMLSMEGHSRIPVNLSKMVFAVEELGVTRLGPFETATPRKWENIGPLRDQWGSVTAIVRVVGSAKAESPADIDVEYSKHGAITDVLAEEHAVHSVREKVAEDCKLVAAMETARERAEVFSGLLDEKTWAEAVNFYNEEYRKMDSEGMPIAGRRLRSEKLDNRMRMAQRDIDQMRERFSDMPMARGYIANMVESKGLTDLLFAVSDDLPETKDVNKLLKFEQGSAYYVVKDITRTAATKDEYLQSKAVRAFSLDAVRSQSMGLIHYKPDNILERMSFRWAEQPDEAPDAAEAAI